MGRVLLAVILSGSLCMTASATKIAGWIALSPDYQGEGSEFIITWDAIPGKSYAVMAAGELDGAWDQLNSEPVVVPSQLGAYSDQTTSGVRFYRISKLDTDPPEVVYLYPGPGGIAVGRQEVLIVHLADETGIVPTSIVFSIGSGSTIGVDDPRLSYSEGILTYTPGPDEYLGDYGETVTASLSVSDTLGHRLENYEWSLNLELEPIIADNVSIIDDASPLTFISMDGDTYTFSYTGDSPAVSVGDILISTDPDNGYKIKVLSVTDYPGSHTVDLLTEPVSLAELLEQGSIRMRQTVAEEPIMSPLYRDGGPAPLNPGRIDLSGTTIYEDTHITVEVTSGFIQFEPDFSVAAEWKNKRLKSFDAEITGTVKIKVVARATAKTAVTYEKKKNLKTIRKFFVQFVGWVPVWEEVVMEFNVGFTAEAEVEGWVEAGFESSKTITVGATLRDDEWSTYRKQKGDFTPIEPTWQVGGGVNLQAYVEPKLTVYLESLVGPSVNLKPYLEFDGNVQVNPPSYELALYAGLTSDLAIELRGWDDSWGELPSWRLLDLRKRLWYKSGASGSSEPDGTPDQAPLVPSDGRAGSHNFDTVGEGHWVRFDAEADMGYVIEVLNVSASLSTIHLSLYDPNQSVICSGLAGRSPFVDWVCPESATYYLKLRPDYGQTGSCDLRILPDDLNPAVDAFETDDELRLAQSIYADGTIQNRSLHTGRDEDWVSFHAEKDMGYVMEVLNLSSGFSYDVELQLYDRNMNRLSWEHTLIDWICPESGSYYLLLFGSYVDSGSYELRVMADEFNGAVDEFETDDEAALAKNIPADGTVQSRNFQTGHDVDWVKFDTEADKGYVIEVLNVSPTLTSVKLDLYDTDINRITGSSAHSPLIDWVCPEAGTYYVRLNSINGETGGYELRVVADESNPAVDAFETDDESRLAKTIATDGTVQSRNFHTGYDVDWTKFEAEADTRYDIQVLNASPGLSLSSFHLYDADMQYMAAAGTDRQIDWVCPASGTYYLKLQPHVDGMGSYELRVAAQ